MLKKILIATFTVWLIAHSTAASACSPMTEGSLRHNIHTVVWGTYLDGKTGSEGTIKVRWTEKGPRMKSIKVHWNSGGDDNDDGVSCPSLSQPVAGDRARFFLHRDADGAYMVLSYDHLREKVER